MFRVSTTPTIRSTQNCNYSLRYCAATSLERGQDCPRWREVAAQKIWPVPDAVVTVLCTTEDGCVWHPKHVEWTWRIINRLLFVASRWTIINFIVTDRIITCALQAVKSLWGVTLYNVMSVLETCVTLPVFRLFCIYRNALSLNIRSLARQHCLSSWGPRRTPWFFCNFSTLWCGRSLKLCFLGFWNYN